MQIGSGEKMKKTTKQPPPNFDIEKVYEMVLRGEAPPSDWVPFIDVLGFASTYIEDISALSNLTALKELHLPGANITDISALSKLTNLEELDLGYSQVSDLSALSNLTALEVLNLRGTDVSDVSELSKLTKLKTLELEDTLVSDVSALVKLVANGLSISGEFAKLPRLDS